MVLTAVRGALGFLTRLPVGHREPEWEAFLASPVAFPLVGYVVGALVAVPFLAPVAPPVAAFLYLLAVYAVTGINHVDGVADLGDAAVVHGGADERRAVMKDTDTGVGALLSVALTVVGLALAALALASFPVEATVTIVLAAEVGAKTGMAAVACFGTAAHEGFGSRLTGRAEPVAFAKPVLVSLPAVLLAWPNPAPAVALLGGVGSAFGLIRWARTRLGGVSGDVFGATNELGRVVGLHLGVIAWTLS